jgi:hypothetical protein
VYSAYGLQVICGRSLPGMIPVCATDTKSPDLRIDLGGAKAAEDDRDKAGETVWYTTDMTDANGNPALKIWKGRTNGDFFIRYSHGLTFRVDSAVSRVSVHCVQAMSEEEVAAFLLGPVLGIVLRLRGVTCLHASAVEMNGKAIAFAGFPGAGKSTSAAAFAQNGHAVLTDDIVAFEKRGRCFLAHPGYPFLNLWPDSVALLSQSSEEWRVSVPVMEKLRVMLDGKDLSFQQEALSLGAIYILGERASGGSRTAATSLSPQQALIELASNTFANKMLDTTMRAAEFRALGELVRSVPIRRLVAPAGPASLKDFYQVTRRDAEAVMKSHVR